MKTQLVLLKCLLALSGLALGGNPGSAAPAVTMEDFRAQPLWATEAEGVADVLGITAVEAAEVFMNVALSDQRANALWARALSLPHPLSAFSPSPEDDVTDEGLKLLLIEPYVRLLSCLTKTTNGLVLFSPNLAEQAARPGSLGHGSVRGQAIQFHGFIDLSASVGVPREGSLPWRNGKRWQGTVTLRIVTREPLEFPGPGFPLAQATHPDLRFLANAFAPDRLPSRGGFDGRPDTLSGWWEAIPVRSIGGTPWLTVSIGAVKWELDGRIRWEFSRSRTADRLGLFSGDRPTGEPVPISSDRAAEVLHALTIPAENWPQVQLTPVVYRYLTEVLSGRLPETAIPTNAALAGLPLRWASEPIDAPLALKQLDARCRSFGLPGLGRLEVLAFWQTFANRPQTPDWWFELTKLAVNRLDVRDLGLGGLIDRALSQPQVLNAKITEWQERNLGRADSDFCEGHRELLVLFLRSLGMSAAGMFPDDPPLIRARVARLRAEPAFAEYQSLIGKAFALSTLNP